MFVHLEKNDEKNPMTQLKYKKTFEKGYKGSTSAFKFNNSM